MWKTKTGTYQVNLAQDNIRKMQNIGCKLCWMKDNPGITDQNNNTWYEDYKDNRDGNESTTENTASLRRLRENITVTTSDKDIVTGYIYHWVKGPCSATPHKDWFIIKPGRNPYRSSTK